MREDVTFDADSYVVKTNALKRVLEVLGLKRVPRPVNDGSAVLSDYFSQPPPRDVPVPSAKTPPRSGGVDV